MCPFRGCGANTQRRDDALLEIPQTVAGHVDFHQAWHIKNHHIKYWLRDHMLGAHVGFYLMCYSEDKKHLLHNQNLDSPLVLPPAELLVDEAQVPPDPLPDDSPAAPTVATPPVAPTVAIPPSSRPTRPHKLPKRFL